MSVESKHLTTDFADALLEIGHRVFIAKGCFIVPPDIRSKFFPNHSKPDSLRRLLRRYGIRMISAVAGYDIFVCATPPDKACPEAYAVGLKIQDKIFAAFPDGPNIHELALGYFTDNQRLKIAFIVSEMNAKQRYLDMLERYYAYQPPAPAPSNKRKRNPTAKFKSNKKHKPGSSAVSTASLPSTPHSLSASGSPNDPAMYSQDATDSLASPQDSGDSSSSSPDAINASAPVPDPNDSSQDPSDSSAALSPSSQGAIDSTSPQDEGNALLALQDPGDSVTPDPPNSSTRSGSYPTCRYRTPESISTANCVSQCRLEESLAYFSQISSSERLFSEYNALHPDLQAIIDIRWVSPRSEAHSSRERKL